MLKNACFAVLSTGIEPVFTPSEGVVLSVERREPVHTLLYVFRLCPSQESNLDQLVRSELFYPLN